MHEPKPFHIDQLAVTEGPGLQIHAVVGEGAESQVVAGDELVGIMNLGPEKAVELIAGLGKALKQHIIAMGAHLIKFGLDVDESCVITFSIGGKMQHAQSTPEECRKIGRKFKAAADHADMMAQASKAGLN